MNDKIDGRFGCPVRETSRLCVSERRIEFETLRS